MTKNKIIFFALLFNIQAISAMNAQHTTNLKKLRKEIRKQEKDAELAQQEREAKGFKIKPLVACIPKTTYENKKLRDDLVKTINTPNFADRKKAISQLSSDLQQKKVKNNQKLVAITNKYNIAVTHANAPCIAQMQSIKVEKNRILHAKNLHEIVKNQAYPSTGDDILTQDITILETAKVIAPNFKVDKNDPYSIQAMDRAKKQVNPILASLFKQLEQQKKALENSTHPDARLVAQHKDTWTQYQNEMTANLLSNVQNLQNINNPNSAQSKLNLLLEKNLRPDTKQRMHVHDLQENQMAYRKKELDYNTGLSLLSNVKKADAAAVTIQTFARTKIAHNKVIRQDHKEREINKQQAMTAMQNFIPTHILKQDQHQKTWTQKIDAEIALGRIDRAVLQPNINSGILDFAQNKEHQAIGRARAQAMLSQIKINADIEDTKRKKEAVILAAKKDRKKFIKKHIPDLTIDIVNKIWPIIDQKQNAELENQKLRNEVQLSINGMIDSIESSVEKNKREEEKKREIARKLKEKKARYAKNQLEKKSHQATAKSDQLTEEAISPISVTTLNTAKSQFTKIVNLLSNFSPIEELSKSDPVNYGNAETNIEAEILNLPTSSSCIQNIATKDDYQTWLYRRKTIEKIKEEQKEAQRKENAKIVLKIKCKSIAKGNLEKARLDKELEANYSIKFVFDEEVSNALARYSKGLHALTKNNNAHANLNSLCSLEAKLKEVEECTQERLAYHLAQNPTIYNDIKSSYLKIQNKISGTERLKIIADGQKHRDQAMTPQLAQVAIQDTLENIHALGGILDITKLQYPQTNDVNLQKLGSISTETLIQAEQEMTARLLSQKKYRTNFQAIAPTITDLLQQANVDSSISLVNSIIQTSGEIALYPKPTQTSANFLDLIRQSVFNTLQRKNELAIDPETPNQMADKAKIHVSVIQAIINAIDKQA